MTLAIMTWNVENFAASAEHFQDKVDYLAQVIEDVDPDVVALQEVLDGDALGALATALDYQALAAGPDGRGNRVAFLVRQGTAIVEQRPIVAWRLPPNTLVQDLGSQGAVETLQQLSRPALQLTIAHAGESLTLINAHLKSKLLTFPGGFFSTKDETLRANAAYFALQRRSAEAKTIREHANELLAQNKRVVVLGDFNDAPDAATTQVLYGPPGSQPRGTQDAIDANGAFQRGDDGDAQRLFNVTKLAPAEIAWSRMQNGQRELIDHILASGALMPRQGKLRRVPELDIRNADSPNIGDRPRTGGIEPDHAPVTATFEVRGRVA
jgi:endonuclease/exonuclease/phosphatase family metal-dependent hydrolase